MDQPRDRSGPQTLHEGPPHTTQTRGRSRPFSLLYAPHRRQSPVVRALIDALIDAAAAQAPPHIPGLG